MKPRTLIVLTALLAGLGLWVAWMRRDADRRPREETVRTGAPVLPGLELARVAAVEIATPARTNRLAQTEAGWVVASKHGYPADMPRLVREMRRLADLKVGARIRGGEDRLREFGLAPDGEAEDRPATVRFLDEGDAPLAEITLGGERRTGDPQFGGFPDGAYVRVGDGPVLLVGESFTGMPRAAEDWMPRQIADVRERLVSWIRVERDGETFGARRENDRWTMDDLAEDELVENRKVTSVARGLEYLRFTRLPDQDLDDETTGMDDPVVVTYGFPNGVEVEVRVGAVAEGATDRYLRLAARQGDLPSPASDESDGSDESEPADDDEAPLPEGPSLADFEKVAGWLYRIASYNADTFRVTREDFINRIVEMEEQEMEEQEMESPSPEADADEESPTPGEGGAPDSAEGEEDEGADEATEAEAGPDAGS